MGKVTVDWWKKQKANAGKGLPSTGFEALLKKYESALASMGKSSTASSIEAAQKALSAVESGRLEAIKILKDDKWSTIRSALTTLAMHVGDEKKALAEAMSQATLERKVELSANDDEAKYERLYAIFEKQEAGMKGHNGRLEFKTALATLVKLDLLADECLKTPHLMKKYQKQKQVLAGKTQEVQRLSDAYELKIGEILKLRRKAIEEVKGEGTAILRAKGQLGSIIQKIAAAKKQGSQDEIGRQKIAAKMIVEGLLAQDKEINDNYLASGTTVKDSTDVKAANMAPEDLTTIIRPFSDELFNLNRANKASMKELQELAKTALS